PSTPARGRWGDSNRIAPGSVPVLRDELAVDLFAPLNAYVLSIPCEPFRSPTTPTARSDDDSIATLF
ncbi:MAG: hypothetical protein JXA30_07440, partial [Deltaproteobacteria bacterium]|nr:hypothetical protein [Deltaproteobacteria bacterium]